MQKEKVLTKKEVMEKIKVLGDIDQETRNSIVCSLIGHSDIVHTCFGEVSCGRCNAKIGDILAGFYPIDECVLIGHDCDTCRANYTKMNWKDKLYAPDPFKKEG